MNKSSGLFLTWCGYSGDLLRIELCADVHTGMHQAELHAKKIMLLYVQRALDLRGLVFCMLQLIWNLYLKYSASLKWMKQFSSRTMYRENIVTQSISQCCNFALKKIYFCCVFFFSSFCDAVQWYCELYTIFALDIEIFKSKYE